MQCKFCGEPLEVIVSGGKDYAYAGYENDDFTVALCNRCEVAFTFPDMTDEELAEYYPADCTAYVPAAGMQGFVQRRVYSSDLDKIKRYRGEVYGLSLFDIGAGRGEFVKVCSDEGLQSTGSEMSQDGVHAAKALYDVDLIYEYAEKINFKDQYDIISMRHVLEHLTDPVQVLTNIYQNGLKKGGTLYLKLPRLKSWESAEFGKHWMDYYLPRHRVHFTTAGIDKLLKDTGFSKIVYYGEHVPTVYDRSMYIQKSRNIAARIYRALPKPVRLPVAMAKCILNGRAHSGRMIVLAQK